MWATRNRPGQASKNFTFSIAARGSRATSRAGRPVSNEGKSMNFVDNCYLIKHAQGWFLWDTGVTDCDRGDAGWSCDRLIPRRRIGAGRRRWREQLDQARLEAVRSSRRWRSRIPIPTTSGMSRCFRHHAVRPEGRIRMAWYQQRAAVQARTSRDQARRVTSDVFRDGSVTILSTPGHTPGHQSLLVKLPKTGAIVLSGDAVHFKGNWDNRARSAA